MTISRRNLIIASVVVVLAAVSLIWVMHGKSSVEEYVAKLRAKGERLYFTDPPFPKMTNGTPQLDKLVRAANSIGGFGPIVVMDVSTSGVAVVAWKRAPMWDGVRSNSMQWPQLLTILQKNDKPLHEIRESVVEPEPDMGWQTNIFAYRRVFIQQRTAVQLLSAATIAELHETNFEGAFENLLAMARLAQMERDENTLVAQMIRVAITGLGLSTTWEALQSDGLSDAQWKQLQNEWSKVDLIKGIERGFIGERLFCFTHMEMARKGETNAVNWSGAPTVKWRDRLQTTIWRATVAQQDEMFYLKTLGHYIDRCRMVSTGTPAVEGSRLLQHDIDELNRVLSQPSAWFKYPFSSIAIANFARACATTFRDETLRRLTITAIGIKRYQMRHGKLPETLDALVPEFCPQVLLDRMDWKPLRYRVNADGTYTLYSVGENGKDDGGNAAWTTNAPPGWLSGMDIVWPRPAGLNARN